MASKTFMRRCQNWYPKLLRLYPKAYRERFAEGMEQTFNDLCLERAKERRGSFGFALWIFLETSAGIFRENATSLIISMKRDSTPFLKFVKYSGIVMCALMVTGIAVLMVLSRGKGEDITGIVAPAILVTMVSGVAAIIASVLQKRAQKALDLNEKTVF